MRGRWVGALAAVSQFAPAFFGALYWRRATRWGALSGLAAGFLVWCYTLLLPSFVHSGWLPQRLLTAGPLDVDWLRPEQLFGLNVGPWSNTVFWSLTFNVAAFALVSLGTRPTLLEQSQAVRFVAPGRSSADTPANLPTVRTGALTAPLLEDLVAKFTGRDQAHTAFRAFYAAHSMGDRKHLGHAESRALTQFAERCLSGAVGAASAQAIMEGLGQVATGQFEVIFDVFGKFSRSLEQNREELQRRLRELSLLFEATRGIAATLEPQVMLDQVVALLHREFEFDVLVVRLRDADGLLRIKSAAGLPEDADLSTRDVPSGQTYFGECFLENEPVLVEDVSQIRKPVVLPTPEPRAPRSFVHVPIAVEERPIGVLSAYSSTGRVYFSPEFVRFLRTLAVQLGLGIHHARIYRELDDLSRELEGKVRQRTDELERANRRLEELDRLKSDFVSTVSHELRTPLTSIRSLSESLLGAPDVPRETQEQFLAIIVQESQRLSRIINQLLDLSRIEAGKMEWRERLGHPVACRCRQGQAHPGFHQSPVQRRQVHAVRWPGPAEHVQARPAGGCRGGGFRYRDRCGPD